MHSCARVRVCACALTHARTCVRCCVCIGSGMRVCVDVALCVPMTIRSATNAIVSILTRDARSVGKPDLHVFLRSWCTLVLSGLFNLNWTSM
jgi:hypothetical protein